MSIMKKMLLIIQGIVLLLFTAQTSEGQTIILTEDFTGFNVGSHTTPSTSDVSQALDTRTGSPGWTGSLIYPAGGEIKIGTSSATGWIETPALDLSQNGGGFELTFDIARWPGDASTVQVYLNGAAIGAILTPTDEFQTAHIKSDNGTVSGKIKIMALTRRFFIDNLVIAGDNLTTAINDKAEYPGEILMFPVPATYKLNLTGIEDFRKIEIYDVTGRLVIHLMTSNKRSVDIPVYELQNGLYFIRLTSDKTMKLLRFVKR
jgi:hypothetical protein